MTFSDIFFTDELVDHIINESLQYSRQKNTSCTSGQKNAEDISSKSFKTAKFTKRSKSADLQGCKPAKRVEEDEPRGSVVEYLTIRRVSFYFHQMVT